MDYMSGLAIPVSQGPIKLASNLDPTIIIALDRTSDFEAYLARKINLGVIRSDLYYIDFLEAEIAARTKRVRDIVLNP